MSLIQDSVVAAQENLYILWDSLAGPTEEPGRPVQEKSTPNIRREVAGGPEEARFRSCVAGFPGGRSTHPCHGGLAKMAAFSMSCGDPASPITR